MDINCIVDIASREVSFQENYRIAAYDHNVDVIHFSVEPIEDFSLNTSSIKIAAQGPNNVRHDYAVDPSTVQIEEETGYITFDWPIPAGVTEMPIGTFKYGDRGQLIFAVCAEIISGDTVSKAWHSDDGIITVVAHLEPESGGGEDPEEGATNAQKIAQLQTDVVVINTQVGALANGSPTPVETIAEMTDESAVYLYTGSETGYTAGNWYFWNGSAWTAGGVYGGAVTDTTLSISGSAADAKAVGDALADKADSANVTALDTRVTAVETGLDGKADADDVESLTEDVADLKDDLNGAIEDSFEVYPSLRPTLTSGYVNANDNSIVASENFGVTAPIAVKKGQIIKLTATGYSTSVGMIATCNADNTSRTTKVRSIDNNEHTYTYTVEEDGYIVCSVKTLYGTDYKLSILVDYYALFDDVATYGDILQIVSAGTVDKPIERNISGSYVFADGTVKQGATLFISQSIVLYPGQILTFNGRGYNTAVAMISEYDSASNTYTPLVISADSTDRTYTYTASEKVTVRCSAVYYASGQNVPYSATITTQDTDSIRISTLEDKVNAISTEIIQYPQLFDNILCIGDSLTVGYDGSGDTPLVKNYPHFLKKLTDAEMTKKAHGGWTTKQIWDGEISTATDLATYDCAIIFLGTNGGLTDTVSTDCKADYTQNADTNTGCYGKIIGKIKADAPNCKIFCVAGVNDYIRRATTMNPAVRALADFYSVGLIDVENCIMSDSGGGDTAERHLYRPIDGIHYNALGYMTLANMFYDAMSEFMSKHLTMF